MDKNINVNGKKVLLFLGGINAQDGVDVLLKSLYHLVNDLNESNFICNIVGGGDALPAAKNIARDLQLEPYVDFKGWITDKKKVQEYLSSAHICMEPAPDNELNRHSTFIKIMEYMCAGKPIVAFDLKETRYSAKNAAILIKPGDSLKFAAAVKKLMDEPILRDKLGSAGEKRIKEKLNWKNASRNLEKAYKSIQ
jgi:glycosyltransferase involved in cell wall biosynthesis